MKKLLPLVAALTLALAPGSAFAKKASKDPAFAETWSADTKASNGKKVSTCVLEIGETGAVSGDAPFAAVPVTTGNAKGEPGGEIIALVPAAELRGFVEKAAKVSKSKGGAFGGKVAYAPTAGTLALINGELALVIGPAVPKLTQKPSELLAAQRAAAPAAAEKPTEEPQDSPGKKKAKKKH